MDSENIEKISNNYRQSLCPLCKSDQIFNVGPINSKGYIYFSTTKIQLSTKPELWSCEACGSSFIQNAVDKTNAIALYSKGSSEERWTKLPFEKAKTRTVVSKLSSLLKPDHKVLDVGCGSGSFLDFAKDKGCKTFGIEYSDSGMKTIRDNGHIGFTDLEDVEESFDLITAFDLIEHLYDVPNFLEICKTKLSKNGKLIILTGNISCKSAKSALSNWWYVQFPEHIVFPSQNFFNSYSDFKVEEWIEVYHAPEAEKSWIIAVLKRLFDIVRRKEYTGASVNSADHYLAVLK